MMEEIAALRTAIDLLHLPSEVHRVREAPLPDGVALLLRVAASEDRAVVHAAELTERPEGVVHEAAGFFIEQILFAPDADSYRVLGTSPNATARELRGNMALLIRWLHPDLDQGEERSVFIGRVTGAWDNLKTKERRLAYDAAHPLKKKRQAPRAGGQVPRQGANGVPRPSASNTPRRKRSKGLIHSSQGKSRGRSFETYLFQRPGRIRRTLIALLGGMRQ